jgi:hypothetical protein
MYSFIGNTVQQFVTSLVKILSKLAIENVCDGLKFDQLSFFEWI